MKKSSSALFIALAVLLVLIWQLAVVQRHSATENPPGFEGEITKATQREHHASGQSHPPAVFSRTGTPSPAKPFQRGANNERDHQVPVTRELPDDLKLSDAAVLAMTPADGRLRLLPEETDLHTLRARRMVLDTGALDKVVDGATSRLLVPTTGNEALVIDIHSIKSRSEQSHTLFGRVEGEEETSNVQLVYHDGILHGSIDRYLADQHLEYRILADGHLMVREFDDSTMTAKCGDPGESPEETAERVRDELSSDNIEMEIAPETNGDPAQDTTGWTTIDVVVGYDKAARIAEGGVSQIEARIISSVDRMSTAFVNSLVTNTELMLLGTIEDPDYVFPGSVNGSMVGELGDLNNTTNGILDTVSNYATLLGADLKSFVVKQADGSAGIAYLPGNSSIVARDYMTSTRITFAHELGHNIGCDHSWGDSSQATTHSRYGWRFIGTGGTKARTIMAYDWNWGNRVPYFANPAVSYLGAATGAVNGYNVLGDTTADQRYYQGGLGYSGSSATRFGFNGSNPSLGANNAMLIKNGGGSYGAGYASNRATRAALAVTSPLAGVEWKEGTAQTITYKGGDMDYTVSVQLYKGGVLQSTIASGFNAIKRSLAWTVPPGLPVGGDYKVRVTFTHPDKAPTFVESGAFTITNLATTVVSQSPTSTTPTSAPLSQLTVTFSAPMKTAAFSIGSDIRTFTGPGGGDLKASITGVTWAAGNTQLTVNFTPQSPLGYYRMVFSGEIENSNGTQLDQDLDGTPGELVEDSYVALVWVVATGQGLQTIWSDLVGTAARGPGWINEGSNSTWTTGIPAENGTTGPSASADGGPIIGQNLTGNITAGENTATYTPTLNCGAYENVTLSFKGWKAAGKGDNFSISAWYQNAWYLIYRNLHSTVGSNDGQWVDYTMPINYIGAGNAPLADYNSSLRLKWSFGDRNASDSPPTSGWHIDSIVIKGIGTGIQPPAPRVVAHTPSGTDPMSVGSVWVDFSQPMDPAGFSLADIVSFSGPAGSITATGFTWLQDSLLRIDFPMQSMEGGYALTLGPQIPDSFGKNLDQDGNGTPGEAGVDGYSAAFVIGVVAGPLDHFEISGIGATQTVGSPINGITITAKDASGITVEDFTGTVAFGGTGGFSGNSANFVDGVVTGVSVTPTVAGNNLTLTVNDGAGHTGTTNITTIQTLYEAWAGGFAPEDDANGDGVENGLAWVLGAANPEANAIGLLPTVDDNSDPDFYIFQYRRSDDAHNSPGTSIVAQHGGDLDAFVALIHDGTDIIITPVNDFYAAGIDKVEVKVRRTSVAGGKIFMRLAVSLPTQQSPLQKQ